MLSVRVGAILLACFLTVPAEAQQQPSVDTVVGHVTSADGTPIMRAELRLVGSGGVALSTVTDSLGQYRFVVGQGGGAYEISARAFGYTPLTTFISTQKGSATIHRELRLSPHAYEVEPVRVVSSSPSQDRSSPGERLAVWNSFLSQHLPVDPGSLADIAATQPGTNRLQPEGLALSIAGQGPDQNRTTVDGATYGGTSLPAEAVRSAGLISTTYDVSRGGFSGGQIAATTISGTNLWGAAVTARLKQQDAHSRELGNSTFDTRDLRVSGGGGGALIRDRLFLYGALDLSAGTSQSATLGQLSTATLRRLGILPDSVSRFLTIAKQLDLARTEDDWRSPTQSQSQSGLARIDYHVSDHEGLALRLDWRSSHLTGLGTSPFRLSTPSDGLSTTDHGVWGEVTSEWQHWTNQLHAYTSVADSRPSGETWLPAGQVLVASDFPTGNSTISNLDFGGSPVLIADTRELRELSDDVIHESENGAHRMKAGMLVQERSATVTTGNPNGSFTYASLGDLELGHPSSFTRTPAASAEILQRSWALYLGDTWLLTRQLQFVYGLRLDARMLAHRMPLVPTLDTLFPTATPQRAPHDWVIAPRAGFRYDFLDQHHWTLDGGVGLFSGGVAIESLAPLWGQTGSTTQAKSLVCVGPAAPSPNWTLYQTNANAVPNACADSSSVFSSRVPSATLFNGNFGAPRNWRGSVGLGGNLGSTWGIRGDALILHGTHLESATDGNLVLSPKFGLPQEGNRPVFVSQMEIDPSSGGIAPAASRSNPSFGVVRVLNARGQSWTSQFTTGITGLISGRTLLALSYTFTHSRFLASGIPIPGSTQGTTAASPNEMEWTGSSYSPAHIFQLVTSRRVTPRLTLSAIGQLSSGLQFTPIVSGDVNGDGIANDRAFVFDPASASDSNLANGMTRLLRNGPTEIRSCLSRQIGHVAAPSSCATTWSPSLDFRAELLAVGNVNSPWMTVALTASNVTSGFDYLLHGPDKLRGWGQIPIPDATLLEVRGFDAQQRAFKYTVNPRFGQAQTEPWLRRPFELSLEVRTTLGSDPRYQPMMRAIEAGLGEAPAAVRAGLAKRIRNVPAIVLQLASTDSGALGLTIQQSAQLQVVADSLSPEIAATVDSLTSLLTNPRPMSPFRRARVQEESKVARQLFDAAVRRTQRLLTPQQWSRLPSWLTTPSEVDELELPSFEKSMSGVP